MLGVRGKGTVTIDSKVHKLIRKLRNQSSRKRFLKVKLRHKKSIGWLMDVEANTANNESSKKY